VSAPKRIQRRRSKGWRMPEGAVYVGRPTVFGNPFRAVKSPCCPTWDVVDDNGVTYLIDHAWTHTHDVSNLRLGSDSDRKFAQTEAARLFAEELTDWFGGRLDNEPGLREAIAGLAGRDLACWCPLDQPCHADVLLELANA
jgi:hypothetical protein